MTDPLDRHRVFSDAVNDLILVAEDEEDVRRLVVATLKRAGFHVLEAGNGAETLEMVRRGPPDLLILDLMLPGMSGLEICRVLRGGNRTKSLPIMMLTAKAQEIDRIVGFEMGADDYVTKPFSPQELVLRVKAQLRAHGEVPPDDTLHVGEIILDRGRYTVRAGKKAVELTATEFKLLALLMERAGRVQSREKLLNEVWGYDFAINSRTVDIHIRRLREKLGKAGAVIETARGLGYRIADAEAK